ncbi:bi-domain-containing oxidoreductase [Aquiflexum sp. LQ15W]|uniref:bi-domain-containing oxidoreductase n=1 Tax=Cognataquiflexum nitidum TaxID=2922272 RepID=UPI001F1392DD|nr:bi-domain-containing oxidoreductase [Cognataquiflexum nitidum]MCH6198334.1 bi-domain-containing oxidoreductase [Cognataquiflexum nitidum]
MLQLTQKLGSGEMEVQEIPYPQLSNGMVLIKTHYSIISAGTEGSTVTAARKSLLGKAKERPQQVRLVLDTLKKQGPIQTYRAVMKKLDSYSPMGYSCAGEVIEVGEDVTEFEVGDYVACGGVGYANHAEINAVPKNLCVKIPSDSNLLNASYNTLGAISMQGVRQADLRVGESCVVLGLGLLGQLACLILKASGLKVIGIDISKAPVDLAIANNAVDVGFVRNEPGIEEKILSYTQGIGADAVIIAAATNSLDPINFAGIVSRKRGRVVILGAVPTGFERDPHWYRKELELRMACSYGPGRYDLNYEEKGIDYPVGYVRWTEKRNMEAFQDLVHRKLLNIGYLTTHVFDFEQAQKAFDLVVNKSEPYVGIALKYKNEKKHVRNKLSIGTSRKTERVNVSFIGAGSYAQGNLLPNFTGVPNVAMKGVLTNTGTTSKRVAEKFGFEFAASDENQIFDGVSNTVFIATRHDSHAKYVKRALKNGLNVFVEKPLCLYESELEEITELYSTTGGRLMIGFNRRFSPLAVEMKKLIGSGQPISMSYRINAGQIPSDSWIQDLEIGGGRIIGEVCHFIDFLSFLSGSLVQSVSAVVLPSPANTNDSVSILLKFKNGSIGTISYLANGSKELPKEYVEVFASGITCILEDFKALKVFGKGKKTKKSLFNQNKGQKEMIVSFLDCLVNGIEEPIPFESIYNVTKTTFKVLESIQSSGNKVLVSND